MKYLKKFNESESIINYSDIKKFCEDNLAYLIDSGFSVDVSFHSNGEFLIVKLLKIENDMYLHFYWDDIKDDFIPFLQVLSDKYNFNNDVSFNYARSENGNIKKSFLGTIKIDTKDVINDNVPQKCSILGITLTKNRFNK